MAPHYTTLKPVGGEIGSACEFERDVRAGLTSTPKSIPSRYFYDDIGSELWQRITALPEYYPTRVEAAIIRAHAEKISRLVGNDATDIVELGCGCGEKTWTILDQLVRDGRDVTYRPLDISDNAMLNMDLELANRFGGKLPMKGVVGEYVRGLAHIHNDMQLTGRKKLVLFLGSNIGNLSDAEAREFLLKLHTCMAPRDRLLIGFDLKKDLRTLTRAYDDASGVTREFNLNLLDRMNRELGAHFDRETFVHYPFYDPALEAMVSWLVSTRDQTVHFPKINQGWVNFREGEGIRTEMSRKFGTVDIRTLLSRARFQIDAQYRDDDNWFADVVARPI